MQCHWQLKYLLYGGPLCLERAGLAFDRAAYPVGFGNVLLLEAVCGRGAVSRVAPELRNSGSLGDQCVVGLLAQLREARGKWILPGELIADVQCVSVLSGRIELASACKLARDIRWRSSMAVWLCRLAAGTGQRHHYDDRMYDFYSHLSPVDSICLIIGQ